MDCIKVNCLAVSPWKLKSEVNCFGLCTATAVLDSPRLCVLSVHCTRPPLAMFVCCAPKTSCSPGPHSSPGRLAYLGPYAPQGSTSLLPKLSVTSKVSARTSYAWVGSRVHFRSSEDVTLLEFTSPVDR